jgi:hypothetical protein
VLREACPSKEFEAGGERSILSLVWMDGARGRGWTWRSARPRQSRQGVRAVPCVERVVSLSRRRLVVPSTQKNRTFARSS